MASQVRPGRPNDCLTVRLTNLSNSLELDKFVKGREAMLNSGSVSLLYQRLAQTLVVGLILFTTFSPQKFTFCSHSETRIPLMWSAGDSTRWGHERNKLVSSEKSWPDSGLSPTAALRKW